MENIMVSTMASITVITEMNKERIYACVGGIKYL